MRAIVLAFVLVVGCYSSHEREQAQDGGAQTCDPSDVGRCLLDQPCYCRIEGDIARCFVCAADCDDRGPDCFLYPSSEGRR